uniref:cGMP-dependent protein kinase interacting domain-containing protein n=1 Tax=Lepeophtheirus salmonis TaxID=72036 RepID=A0A0K2UHG6_LEPSM
MEELLQNEIDTRSIDCDASRVVEECMMFEDATKWVESDKFGDVPHQKTGATSLHVAAAKGYIKVIGLLLECNAPINIQDYDGWTPLHAAAHWSQREAIDLLCKNHADMDIKNYVGQTCFDVADPDVLKFLEDLKRKQASMQKDRPDFRNLANRPSTTTTSSLAHSGGRRSINLVTNNNNNNIVNSNNRNIKIIADDNSDRSSITRLSIDDKELRLKKDSSYERDSLRGSSLVSETIQESNKSNAESDSDVGRKNRANLSDNNSLPKITLSKDDSSNKVPGYSPPHPAESDKKKPISSSPSESSDDVHPWRRPVSLRSRPVSSTLNSKKDDSSDSEVPLRRIHSFESDEKKRYEPDGGNRVKSDSSLANNSLSSKHQPPQSHVRSVVDEKMNSSVPSTKEDDHPSMNDKSTLGSVFKNFFKSFVPPVRDEESETQRKAHAKRVRETRRSTQGVTLEDLKSAEQLVKKKQQQENQIRTSELQQLAAAASGGVGSTATTTVTTSATLVTSGGSSPASTPSSTSSAYDRKPSWRLRSSEGANDRNRNLSGDAKTSSFCGGASGNNPSSSSNNKYLHPNNAHQPTSGYHNKSMEKDSHNGGDIDYKKLWEESQLDNSRLRDELSKSEDTRGRLEGALHSASKPQMSETEKREKRALEKKLSEMEEELKQIEHLKNEIQRLRDENGALIRVISKLSK